MFKLATTILFLLIFSNAYGQIWHLNRVDSSAEFKYEYWLRFDNKEDTSSFILKNIAGYSTPSIHLHNNKGDTIGFATILITSLKTKTFYEFLSEGPNQLNLKPGSYNIRVDARGYDMFSVNFKILKNQSFDLDIKLGLSRSGIYQINSIEKLDDKEMYRIENCVKESKSDFYKCSVKKRYSVTMHI